MSSLVHSAAGAAPYPADQASPFLPDRQHDRVVYWMGTPVADLPRAELEEALTMLGREVEELRGRLLKADLERVRLASEAGRLLNKRWWE